MKTPPPDYESMSDEELDVLLAEKIMKWTTRGFEDTNQFCYGEGSNPWSFRMNFDEWNPTHKDSEQIETHIFTKLEARGCSMLAISPVNRIKAICCLYAWEDLNGN